MRFTDHGVAMYTSQYNGKDSPVSDMDELSAANLVLLDEEDADLALLLAAGCRRSTRGSHTHTHTHTHTALDARDTQNYHSTQQENTSIHIHI